MQVSLKYVVNSEVVGESVLRDIELKLVAELIKGSRRSDRELAKQLHISQPTVTRIRNKLEKEGIVREYTMIPNFNRLGYQIVSITFAKLEEPVSQKTMDETRRHSREMEKENPSPTIVAMRGIGCNADYVSVAFHRNYSEYSLYLGYIRRFPHLKVDEIKSFLIDLQDESHFRYLTLSVFADYLLRTKENP
jgi:Lrp/AsnC family transcriptional regulator for asnA, asnC and gidA